MLTLNGKDVTLKRRTPLFFNGGSVVNYNGGLAILTGRDIYNTVINGAEIPPPDNGCVLYYPGLPAQGTTITDYSGLGNHGTISDPINMWKRLPSGLWVSDFDGLNDQISIGTTNIILTGSYPFTVSAWFNPASTGNTGYGFIALHQTDPTKDFISFYGSAGSVIPAKVYIGFRGTNTAAQWDIVNAGWANKWNKIDMAYTGGDKTLVASYALYWQGNLYTTGKATVNVGGTGTGNLIGQDGTGAGFQKMRAGLISATNTAVTPAQSASNFNQERHLFGI